MKQKNATPTKEQQEVLKKHGLNGVTWAVVKDFSYSMIVKHRITGEFKMLEKGKGELNGKE